MPSQKSHVRITIEAGGKRFSLNCSRLLHNRYSVKLGRSRSAKMPVSTLTDIFDAGRKWAVKQESRFL